MKTMIEKMAEIIETAAPVGAGAPKIKGVYALSFARFILEAMADPTEAMIAGSGDAAQWRRMVGLALHDPADSAVWLEAVAKSDEVLTPVGEGMRSAIAAAWGPDSADQLIPKKVN